MAINKLFLFSFVFLLLSVSLVSASYGQNAYGSGFYGAEPVSYAGGTPGGSDTPAPTVNETANATNATAPSATPPAGGEVTGGTGGEGGAATTEEQPAAQEEEQPPAGNIAEQVSQFATKSPAITIVVVAVVILGILWLVRSKLGL